MGFVGELPKIVNGTLLFRRMHRRRWAPFSKKRPYYGLLATTKPAVMPFLGCEIGEILIMEKNAVV